MNGILEFFKFYFSAGTLHSVHSPFLFQFCQYCLDDQRSYYAFKAINQLRNKLLKEKHTFQQLDFGAGSKVYNTREKSVASIAKSSATRPFFGELLFKMVHLYKPQTILELGTSLGLGTSYLSLPGAHHQCFTLEGCPETARLAKVNLENLKTERIQQIIGPFEKTLPELLGNIDTIDFLFVDGNHQKAPTLDYFEKCLSKANDNSIFILDDIYWSSEMKAAWQEIKEHPKVTTTIDLFQFGIVFFKKDFKAKQHLKLVPLRWKPWRVW